MCEEVDVRTATMFEVFCLIWGHIGKRMFEERNEARFAGRVVYKFIVLGSKAHFGQLNLTILV